MSRPVETQQQDFGSKDTSLSTPAVSRATPQHYLSMSLTNEAVKTSPASSNKSPVKRILRSFARSKSSSQIQRTSSSSLTAVINSDDEGSDSHYYYSSSQPLTKAVIHANSSTNLQDFPAEIEVVYEEGVVVVTEQHSPLPCSDAAPTAEAAAAAAAQRKRSDTLLPPNSSTATATTTAASTKQRRPLLKKKSIHDIQKYPQARSRYNIALQKIHNQQWEQALEEVAQGMELLPHLEDDSTTRRPQLYWELVILQAEVLGRQGKYSESLATYQSVLRAYEQDVTAGDCVLCARLYYTCGRLSVYLKHFEQAIDYYTKELQLTRAILKDSLSVARIYHELARVAKEGIGDWERALGYLQQAFLIEVEVWKNARNASSKEHQDDFADVTAQMNDTKKCMGKILFALGRIDEAISLS